MQLIDIDERTTPIGLFHYAHSYAASAICITEQEIDAVHPDAPIRFLFSHALELYLKSFLLLHGITMERLRSREFGHDLVKLAEEAQQHQLLISRTYLDQLAVANQQILDRYIVVGVRRVLEPETLHSICKDFNQKIGGLIYSEAKIGRNLPTLR